MNQRNEAFFVGRAVTSLQTMLRTIAEVTPSIPTVIPDGIYGDETKAAVLAFQRQHGLQPTGITDYDTWREIRKVYKAASVETSPAEPLEIVMNPNQIMGPGSDNLNVLLVQAMLHNLHLVYPNMPDCSLSGVCCDKTVEAIRQLQQIAGMTPSGFIDKQSWNLLAALYRQAVGDGDRKTHCGKQQE